MQYGYLFSFLSVLLGFLNISVCNMLYEIWFIVCIDLLPVLRVPFSSEGLLSTNFLGYYMSCCDYVLEEQTQRRGYNVDWLQVS